MSAQISPDITQIPPDLERLGLLAFEGRFPLLLAEAAAVHHIPVVAFGVEGITPPELEQMVERLHWMKLGQISKFIEKMHEENIRHVVMAGRVQHNSIWKYRGFDKRGLKVLGRLINRKANTVLRAIVDELALENIQVLDQNLFIRSCMPEKGLLTPWRPLTRREEADIEFGFPIARQVAGIDIGQTLVVKDLAVIAVESLEGTDETIQRAGRITGGGNVVIKVSKPHQDSRFDIPVVGPGTIRSLQKAGGGVLAIMSQQALFFDQQEALEIARQADIAVTVI
ncbi:UDP-2,3-diacylglucosamine diphosphatase LpxI [bacterium]|nr:UDP-2,3-diacylglucosamine diphosphatase LpxI [bacterium]